MKKVAENVVITPLTEDEAGRLRALETSVSMELGDGFAAAVTSGEALTEIRDGLLYRVEYKTFEKYVVAKFQLSRGYAYELMGVSTVVGVLSDASDIPIKPTSITQVKPLLRFKNDPAKVVGLWKYAAKWVGSDEVVTAAAINHAVRFGLERPKRSYRPRPKPALYADPKKMARFILSEEGLEYANKLYGFLDSELRTAASNNSAKAVA